MDEMDIDKLNIGQDSDIKSAISELETINNLKKVQQKEARRELIDNESSQKVSWMVRMMMKMSFGYIRKPEFAKSILISLAIILIIISWVFFTKSTVRHSTMSIELQNKIKDLKFRPSDIRP